MSRMWGSRMRSHRLCRDPNNLHWVGEIFSSKMLWLVLKRTFINKTNFQTKVFRFKCWFQAHWGRIHSAWKFTLHYSQRFSSLHVYYKSYYPEIWIIVWTLRNKTFSPIDWILYFSIMHGFDASACLFSNHATLFFVTNFETNGFSMFCRKNIDLF